MKRPAPLTGWRARATPGLLCAVLVIGWSAGFLATRPILAGDADLWYHLTCGRYLFEHRAIPQESFFSFLSPPRPLVDYAWLFQGLIYGIHRWWGYEGLIVLRTLAYLATLLVVCRYLLRGRGRSADAWVWPALVVALYSAAVFPRFMAVRPHVMTYLLIALVLYLLDARPRRGLLALPLLAALWVNLHGIMFPTLLLILGAYAAEYAVGRLRGAVQPGPSENRWLASLCLGMAAVFLTPHGPRLLEVAAIPLDFMVRFTSEFGAASPGTLLHELTSFSTSGLALVGATPANALIGLATANLILSSLNRRLRLSHGLLWLGGVVLCLRGRRFLYELVLLSLPLLRAAPLAVVWPVRPSRRIRTLAAWGLAGLLALVPIVSLRSVFGVRGRHPFPSGMQPEGVAAFLRRVGGGGTVLNHPNGGGYLAWELYPEYRILMSMQFPIPFTTEDMYAGLFAFSRKETLDRLVSRYDPTFINVPLGMRDFPAMLRDLPDYQLVYFDEREALYANRRARPQLAAQYDLSGLDPFDLYGKDVKELLKDRERAERLLDVLGRLQAMVPSHGLAHHVASLHHNQTGAYAQAIPHAEVLMREFPDWPTGYELAGEAWQGLGEWSSALAVYRRGLRAAPRYGRERFYAGMGAVHLRQQRYQQAYRALRRGVDVFADGTSVEQLVDFATAALRSGHRREAGAALTYLAEVRLGPDDAAWKERVLALQAER